MRISSSVRHPKIPVTPGQEGQFIAHSFEYGLPIPDLWLREQTHGRIPRAIFALQQPAPVMGEWNQRPHRSRQGPGQMADRCIHRDYQIEIRYRGSGVLKIIQEWSCIEERAWNIAK